MFSEILLRTVFKTCLDTLYIRCRFSIALQRGKCMKKVCKVYFMCTYSRSNDSSISLLPFVFQCNFPQVSIQMQKKKIFFLSCFLIFSHKKIEPLSGQILLGLKPDNNPTMFLTLCILHLFMKKSHQTTFLLFLCISDTFFEIL